MHWRVISTFLLLAVLVTCVWFSVCPLRDTEAHQSDGRKLGVASDSKKDANSRGAKGNSAHSALVDRRNLHEEDADSKHDQTVDKEDADSKNDHEDEASVIDYIIISCYLFTFWWSILWGMKIFIQRTKSLRELLGGPAWDPLGSYHLVGSTNTSGSTAALEGGGRAATGTYLPSALTKEALFVLVAQPLGICAISWLSTKLPDVKVYGFTLAERGHVQRWIPFLSLLLVWRSCKVDAALLRRYSTKESDKEQTMQKLARRDCHALSNAEEPKFVLSKAEVADAAADWTALLQVYIRETSNAKVQVRVRAAWKSAPLILACIEHVGISGVMGLTLFLATTCQVILVLGGNDIESASLSGLGGVSGLLREGDQTTDGNQDYSVVAVAFLSRALGECGWQLVLQGSAAMAFDDADPFLLISMALSSALIFPKTIEFYKQMYNAVNIRCSRWIFALVASGLPALAVWNAVRMFFSYFICPSGIWGVSTGCVSL